MTNVETFSFWVAMVSIGLSAVLYWWQLVTTGKRETTVEAEKSLAKVRHRKASYLALIIAGIGLVSLTLSIATRAVITGHGPFSNMYEFVVAFSWGIVVMGLFFSWRYRTPLLNAVGLTIGLGMLVYAYTLPSRPIPLVPALQQSLLLSTHVATAVIAYGTFAIGFGAAVLYLVQQRFALSWLPELKVLDDLSYHTVLIGFPFMTLVIVLGAVWADIAWGRPWGWDPKETASLVTWLIYASYLHVRLMRGWRSSKAIVLLIIGFIAVLFTFFGNYIFAGLHSYK